MLKGDARMPYTPKKGRGRTSTTQRKKKQLTDAQSRGFSGERLNPRGEKKSKGVQDAQRSPIHDAKGNEKKSKKEFSPTKKSILRGT